MKTPAFPEGRRFAFTIVDDTDVGTAENLRPVYELLRQLGMRTTKTVWPIGWKAGWSAFISSQTLDDPEYLAFIRELHDSGFEITWHGATMESSPRERTIEALDRFRDLFGHYPRIHVNHSRNRENLYWGRERLDSPILRRLYDLLAGGGATFEGHVKESPFWWGDLAQQHVEYARNLTFDDVNVARINPTIPYRDPRRPLVRWWFSACDADDVDAFNMLLAPGNQQRLEEEGGICIIATHFGKRFVTDGAVHPLTRQRLTELAARPGWFPPVGTLLDWMRETRNGSDELPSSEWRRMQWRWARDLAVRRFGSRTRNRAASHR